MDKVDKAKCSSTGESDKSSGSGDGGKSEKRRGRSRSPCRSKRNGRRKDRSRDRSSSRRRRKERKRRSSSSSSSSRSRSKNRRSKYSSRSRRRSSRNSSDDNSDQQWDYKTQYDSYKYQEPNSTIMVRCLAPHLTENDIRQDLLRGGFMVKEIRLIKNRETGQSRGFAFIEFNSVADAVRWMDIKKGVLLLHDQFQSSLLYSVPKVTGSDGTKKMVGSASDWLCESCHGQNFKRREFCYKCSAPRPEVVSELSREISSYPTQRIILSNLDMLTTEEGVLQVFQSRASLALLPIKSVRIAREPGSSISKGICYVEANNVTEASHLLAILHNMEIDGRTVSAAYGKTANPETLLKNINAAATAVAAAQWTNGSAPGASSTVMGSGPPCTEVKTEADVEKMAKYCAFLYAKNHKEYSSYLDYYRQYYKAELAKVSSEHQQSSRSETTGVAASGSHASSGWSDVKEAGVVQSAPDTSRYQYDETSGYYYDPESCLYYDATTQYFYDPVKQQFLQWSPEDQKYLAVQSSPSGDGEEKEKKGERQDKKVKVAKSVAKEMQKWVKTLNQKKDAFKAVPAEIDKSVATSASATASTKFSISSDQEYIYTAPESLTAYQPAVMVESIPMPGSDSDSDEGQEVNSSKEPSIVDESKLACLLCKRRFPTKEVLQKHVKMSDLHKKNLECLDPNSSSISYRDRAKERREMFGTHVDVSKNELKDLYLKSKEDLSTTFVEEPTVNGINEDNIGNKMLQKMGWQKGQGLGKDNQGRVDIIMTDRRAEKVGLGIKGAEVDDEKLDPQAKIRKRTLARYQELG